MKGARARALFERLGLVLPQVLVDRPPNPALRIAVRHPIPAEQLSLGGQRQAGDGPARGQSLEQQLLAPLPEIVSGRAGPAGQAAELPHGAPRQAIAQREDVALGVRVVGRGPASPLRPGVAALARTSTLA